MVGQPPKQHLKHMPSISLAALMLAAAAACAPTEEGVVQGRPGDAAIALSEGACPQTCPVYDMTLHPDGAYTLNGQKFVKQTGVTEGNIGKGAWDAAEDLLESAGFWTMKQVQTRKTVSNCEPEQPEVLVTWRTAEGKEKTVTYNAGCGVPKMRKLIGELRTALKFDELVWTDAKFDPVTGQQR